MVLPRHASRLLQALTFLLPLGLALLFPPQIAFAGKKGGAKLPEQKPQPDPDGEAAKKKAAEERARLQSKRGSGKTVATSAQGVLGAAPTNAPGLKPTLG